MFLARDEGRAGSGIPGKGASPPGRQRYGSCREAAVYYFYYALQMSYVYWSSVSVTFTTPAPFINSDGQAPRKMCLCCEDGLAPLHTVCSPIWDNSGRLSPESLISQPIIIISQRHDNSASGDGTAAMAKPDPHPAARKSRLAPEEGPS